MKRTQRSVYAASTPCSYECEVIGTYFSGLYERLGHEDRQRFLACFERLVGTEAPGLETRRAEYLVNAFEQKLEGFGDECGLVVARRYVTEAKGYLPNYPRAAAHTIAWGISCIRSDHLNPIETGFALFNGVLAINLKCKERTG